MLPFCEKTAPVTEILLPLIEETRQAAGENAYSKIGMTHLASCWAIPRES